MNHGDLEEEGRGRSVLTNVLTMCTLAGKWENVINLYGVPKNRFTKITDSLGTALHVAVERNQENVVKNLVNQINRSKYDAKNHPLEVTNKSGDTPLHVAASRGFTKICKIIIGLNNERKSLVSQRNIRGETPLFQAVINGQTQVFAYLRSISDAKDDNPRDLVRDNDDNILHCAITSEHFDLALIIMYYYDFLSKMRNKEKLTPLTVLATRSSAFKSASTLSLWKQIQYNCILVEPSLEVERQMEKIQKKLEEMDKPTESDEQKYPKNYATLYEFFVRSLSLAIGKMFREENQVDTENPPINEQFGFGLLPPNYETLQQFVKSAFVHILGLSGVDINEVKKTKQRHQWGRQLFKIMMLVAPPVEDYIGDGKIPAYGEFDPDIFDIPNQGVQDFDMAMAGESSHSEELKEERRPQVDGNTDTLSQNDTKNETDQHVDEQNTVIIRREITRSEVLEEERKPKVDGRIETLCRSEAEKEIEQHADEKNIFIIRRKTKCSELLEEETKPKDDGKTKTSSDILEDKTVLAAARNGIVEMVNGILSDFDNIIYETNAQEENMLLVAVRNKKPLLVENLRKKFQKERPEVWNTLTLAVNKDGKTILHMAAYASEEYKTWQISGCALQLIWDVNWFQYIKSLVPEHYHLRTDKNNQTANEIFKEEHKELRKDSSEWLKETSESCSVVAALVAGVSFATAATIPGGNNDEGFPHLEDKPAFNAFVISSLVGLGFSLTGLIMFLTILTSRKLYGEFRRDLPLKLLLGLSSLFVSIVALIVTFCTSHSFLFTHKYKTVIFPIYVATCLPVTFYAVAQLPLYFDLLKTILFEVPMANSEGDSL